MAVACGRPVLIRLLQTTGFDRIVTVARTVGQASAALQGSGDRDAEHRAMSHSDRLGGRRSA